MFKKCLIERQTKSGKQFRFPEIFAACPHGVKVLHLPLINA
jgi:hypothetical protein